MLYFDEMKMDHILYMKMCLQQEDYEDEQKKEGIL
jgi:hypothetical protein